MLKKLQHLNPELVHLSSAAYRRSGELAANDLTQLSHLHWIFSGVLLALIVCSLGLILVLSWHNRLLSDAHDEVNGLVKDLTSTSKELSDANQRAHQAMEEVQLQNQILKARDLELHTQNARFDAALNNMSQALCMVDANQRLIVCNVRFLELFGLSTRRGPGRAPGGRRVPRHGRHRPLRSRSWSRPCASNSRRWCLPTSRAASCRRSRAGPRSRCRTSR